MMGITSIVYFCMFMCCFTAILGSFYDIFKKHGEEAKEERGVQKTLIQQDIVGDYLKDVLSPTMYTVALSVMFVYVLLKNNVLEYSK